MNHRLFAICAVFALFSGANAAARGTEENSWPIRVAQRDETGTVRQWQAVGPLLFKKPAPDQGTYRGFRPFYLRQDNASGVLVESTVLYPLFIRRQNDTTATWSVFNLINHTGPTSVAAVGLEPKAFDVWPVYFSRDTGSPATSYQAVFPVAGTIKSRFGYDQLQWVAFPLFWQSSRAGVVTTSTPWPFIKRSTGNGHRGFALWPLFGQSEKPGAYRKQFYLWPLIYKNESRLDEPQPRVQQGFLPFYTHERSAGVVSENFLWPFFGYTDRTAPKRYHEKRYLWPLLVQGRGEERYVNRWGPFYTHSVIKGADKTWIGWPLIRQQHWTDDDIVRHRSQLLFFLYWSEEQRSAFNPQLPSASKTHLWPLLSVWNNGAGRRQVQFPSPFEVFFPGNDKIRQLYSPLFALYRMDQRSPGEVRTSLLWNAITWHRRPEQREFHLGPLFSSEHGTAGGRIALGNGLIGLRRESGRRVWRLFLFDFSARSEQSAPQPTP